MSCTNTFHSSHRPEHLDKRFSQGSSRNLDTDMDMEDEQNVDDSIASTPIDGGPSQTWKYATVDPVDQGQGPTDEASERGNIEGRNTSSPTPPLTEERLHPETPNDNDCDIDEGDQEQKANAEWKVEDGKGDENAGDKSCRICFAGPEEEMILGRMISPCLCAGSMRYVHVKCLNAWRGTGTNACHYRYQLRRTLISGLATSRPILLLSTLLAFFSLTLSLGQLLHFSLHHSPTISRTLLSRHSSRVTSMFDLFDDPFAAADGGGPVIIVGGGGTLIWDVFISAIQTFVEISNGFIAYKDKLSATLALPGSVASVIFELVVRSLLGLAMLGSMSFMSLIITLPLFGPLQLLNGLRGFGFLGRRFGRRTANAAGGGGNGNTSIGSIMVVILVLIGAANTMVQFYRLVSRLTQRLLLYVETQILEVNSEEIRAQRKKKEKEEREKRKRERWYVRWVKDGQYKRIDGWKEVFVRFSLLVDRCFEVLRGGRGNEHEHVE
ncbi:uncharacterized protein I303_106383 [Kwoniella dejecticola CBS 10117]|uniref:RING-CH-type domain-containing protein n=1 Tax=Kwoniella dejecticola CBS 10117 TaxID=1296121 RepID=A0AAJ8KTU7_9TREE